MPTVERRSLWGRLARLTIDEWEIGRLERDERNRVAEYRRRQHLREGEGSLLDPQRVYVAARRSLRMSNAILRKLLERL